MKPVHPLALSSGQLRDGEMPMIEMDNLICGEDAFGSGAGGLRRDYRSVALWS